MTRARRRADPVPAVRRDLVPRLLILPAVLLELLVHVLPVLVGIVVGFLRLDRQSLWDWSSAPFIGLGNYRLGLDPGGPIGSELLASAGRTGLYAVLVVVIAWALGLAATVLLAGPFRGRGLFQAFFLVPFALPAYVTVLTWRLMFDRDTGIVNQLLVDDLHLLTARPFWLIGDNAFWAVVIVGAWRMWPFAYLVLSASLRAVPVDVYEAATVDGAGNWQRLRWVILPATRRAGILVALVSGLWSVTDFSTPYLLFDSDPPPAATLLGNLVYAKAFTDFDLGLASAMNVLIALLLLLAVWLVGRRLASRVRVDG